jgi:hypothetical protein
MAGARRVIWQVGSVLLPLRAGETVRLRQERRGSSEVPEYKGCLTAVQP